MKRLYFAFALFAAILFVGIGTASAGPITPSCTTFGTLSAATFGGSGIPNDAVCIGSFTDSAGNTVTLGLTATPRFSDPAVLNDGVGTFTAKAAPDGSNPALAGFNFDFYMSATGGSTTYKLMYDLDPGVGTDSSALGTWTFGSPTQDSENLGFAFLRTGFSTIVVPPSSASTFDPFAVGEYSFRLDALNDAGVLGSVSILVDTTKDGLPAPVPEPASMLLLGTGLAGIATRARRRKKAA